jgi:hypothetical protein
LNPVYLARGMLPSIFGWLYHMSRRRASNTQGVGGA